MYTRFVWSGGLTKLPTVDVSTDAQISARQGLEGLGFHYLATGRIDPRGSVEAGREVADGEGVGAGIGCFATVFARGNSRARGAGTG